jgi:hypothetical protein
MTDRTWKIRDQLSDGSWGPEREVTLAQFKADNEAKKTIALAKFKANVAEMVR